MNGIHSVLRSFVLCLVISMAGCQLGAPKVELIRSEIPRVELPDVAEEQVGQLVAGNNAFAFDLYHTITAKDRQNLIFSPYSIWVAFSMVYAGAQGETEAQMTQVLHFLTQDTQHPVLNAIDQRLLALKNAKSEEEESLPFQLNIANSVWGQQGYAFKKAYLDILATQYGAGLRAVDFQESPDEAQQAINAWVSKETGEHIKEIVTPGSLNSTTRLVLANAIYFMAGWAYPFDQADTTDAAFILLDGSRVTTPQMRAQIRLDYMQGDGFQAVRLPYVDQSVDMWVVLPNQGQFEVVQKQLSVDLLGMVQKQAETSEVSLTLPRFDYESDLSLPEPLQRMGLTDAFCPGTDFNGIVEGGGLCIGEALHRATITVDENGTEAAAATMVMMEVSIVQQVEMTIDRPFLFAILMRETGLILFLGQVLNPAN